MTTTRKWTLVLAGGDGTRLRELTREIEGRPMPKQYCRILGDRSLLEATLARGRHFVQPDRTLVVVNRDHLPFGSRQLEALPATNLVVQPCNRDTGPGIVLGLLAVAARDPEAVVALLPSDHYVGDDAAFMAHVEEAARIVSRRPAAILLLGIAPEEPDSEMGYIVPGAALEGEPDVRCVRTFVEKPTAAEARRLVARGALWNAFVMVFRVDRMLELLQQVVPAEVDAVRRATAEPGRMGRLYPAIDAWSFSHRFLSRVAGELAVLRVEGVHWSDWGTPESIERALRALRKTPPWQDHGAAAVASKAGSR